VHGYVRAQAESVRPDTMVVAGPISTDLAAWAGFGKGIKLEKLPGAQVIGCNPGPQSCGRVRITGRDAEAPLEVIRNHLAHEYDRRIAVANVRFMQRLFAQPATRSTSRTRCCRERAWRATRRFSSPSTA
jgi:choline dehydrogenase-like flavoprotein